MTAGPINALAGRRVIDLSETVAGSYGTKLLADAGAEVVKVEPEAGHPLRRWSASGSVGSDGDPDGALFRFLATGQRSVVADLDTLEGRARLLELAEGADLLVQTERPGHLESLGLGLTDLKRVNPALTTISITPFGQQGPRSGDERSEFLLQALSGSTHTHGSHGRVPLAVGGGIGDWIAGAYAATGALAALARTRQTGQGELVDVSTLECLAVTFVCYPSVAANAPGGTRRRNLYSLIPGIEPCRAGFVGFTTLTVQQWRDFAALIDRPDLLEDHGLDDLRTRVERMDELLEIIHAWTTERDGADIVERAALFRVPAAPVLNGALLTGLDHLAARELFAVNPRGGFPHPRPPFRSTLTAPAPVEPAPRKGEHDTTVFAPRPPSRRTVSPAAEAPFPLEGIRVFDFTAFWAGPCATQYLATLGADVIKVESIQRPDAMRFNVTVPPTVEQWYEQGYLYLSANLNKRGVTLNLADPRGRELALRLAATCDVVVENFSPRVVEQFGLTYEELRAAREDLIVLRMPGWGLEGPWRDRPGFATTMEQASGMAWVTGYEDGPPMSPGLCDPLAGVHGSFAVLAALEHRRVTGEGQQIELSMIDLAVNVAAEQLIEYAAYGHLMTRVGNDGPQAAPQGVYACAGEEEWIAISVADDGEWRALGHALESPPWILDPRFAEAGGRLAARPELDEGLGAWCGTRSLAQALEVFRAAGVPVEPVVAAYDIDQDAQMRARGFFEEVGHPVAGSLRYPGWPMRLSGGPDGWYRSPAPLLGQHTEEVLVKELGVSEAELGELRRDGVIGDRPFGL
jgi:crotonobetainyl-CoA:carnitine CoA-transferase CaiB-like acyl-CoA transferase